VKLYVPIAIALASFGGARAAREAIRTAAENNVEPPYAPSATAAPFVASGYRELAADLFFVRLLGYYGSATNDAESLATLAEAERALDPQFQRIYIVGAIAMQSAKTGVDNSIHLRAIAHFEAGMRAFPDNWRFPSLAGQSYLVDLQTKDPVQRRAWDQKGTLLLETAARKPNAPAEAGLTAASIQSKMGQTERAVSNLKEMLLVTSDDRARAGILEQLAKVTNDNQDAIAAEILEASKRFDADWKAVRPALPASFYVLLGAPQGTTFDMEDLAIGGRAPMIEPVERLEPLD
jgi:hypothetical protein